MKRCVIVGGAPIADCESQKEYFKEGDFFIVCDCGLRHCVPLGITPDLIIGDFDSHPLPEADCEIIVLPREKDDTDTFFAAKEGIRRGFDEFLLIGVIGGRLDHTLGNVSILLYLDSLGKSAIAADDADTLRTLLGNRDKCRLAVYRGRGRKNNIFTVLLPHDLT